MGLDEQPERCSDVVGEHGDVPGFPVGRWGGTRDLGRASAPVGRGSGSIALGRRVGVRGVTECEPPFDLPADSPGHQRRTVVSDIDRLFGFLTMAGARLPLRCRGTSIVTGPTLSVSTVLNLVPSRSSLCHGRPRHACRSPGGRSFPRPRRPSGPPSWSTPLAARPGPVIATAREGAELTGSRAIASSSSDDSANSPPHPTTPPSRRGSTSSMPTAPATAASMSEGCPSSSSVFDRLTPACVSVISDPFPPTL
jgi:hypothetical protein